MSTAVFDTLRFSRGLREVGVPEQQADRQAELMAEAFSAFADKLVTKDYFSEVLDARLKQQSAELEHRIVEQMNERFAEQDAKLEARIGELDEKFTARIGELDQKWSSRFADHDARFARLDRTLLLHTWMLGLITLVLVVPQLQAWVA